MFIIKCFHPTLWITKSCCRAVPDGRFEVQNDPIYTNIGFSISALSKEYRTWRKGKTNFSCSHLAVNITRCRVSCCAEQPPVSMRGSFPESKNPYSNQERGPTFRVIGEPGEAQILCFAGLYTGGSDGPPRDQVEARFFTFFLVRQSRKREAEPHP